MGRKGWGSTSVLALLAASIAAPVAYADEVEEIIVTSRKREERLQDVPVAVSAFTQKDIEVLKPRTLRDLDGLAPNVYINQNTAGPGAAAIFIRGQGYADIELTQNPAVGVIFDGIFLGTSTGQLVDSFDLAQIEVNRGPQGIYEGKNTNGGTIKLTRSLPTMEWGFKGSASYGKYDELVLRGVANIPIIKDRVGLKLGYTYKNRDGYDQDLYDRKSRGDVEYTGINTALRAKIGEITEALIIFDYIADRSEGIPVQVRQDLPAVATGATASLDLLDDGLINGSNTVLTGNPYNLGRHQVLNDFPERSYYDVLRGSAQFTFNTPVGQIVSITGYMRAHDFTRQDFDGTCKTDLQGLGCAQNAITARVDFAPFAGFPFGTFGPPVNVPLGNPFLFPAAALHTTRDRDYKQISQELRMSSDVTNWLNILAGVYYYQHEIGHTQLTNLGFPASRQDTGEKYDSISFFGVTRIKVLPTVEVNLGARWIRETKRFNTQFETGTGAIGTGIPVVPRIDDSKEWSDTITRAGVDWKITPNNLFYFSRSEGFRSGGFSLRGTLSEQLAGQTNCPNPGPVGTITCPGNNFLTYEPETVTTYEIGTKNRFLDEQITFNVAAFLNRTENYQANFVVVTPGYGPGTNTYINNIDEARVKGIEAELIYRPAFFEGLTIFGSIGIQKGKFKKGLIDSRRLPVGPGAQAGSSGVTDVLATGTNILGFNPDYNYAIRANYETPVMGGTLNLGIGWKYTDDVVYGAFGLTPDVEPGYGLLDASISYEFGHYRVSVFGKNLLDKAYRFQSLPSVFFQGWGDPLTIAGEVAVNF